MPRRNAAAIVGVCAMLLVVLAVFIWLAAGMLGIGDSASTATIPVGQVTTPTVNPGPTPKPAAEVSFTPNVPEPPKAQKNKIGTSVDGVAIDAYRFGTGSRRYLVIGGVHGDEYGSAVAEAFIKRLQADPSLIPGDTEIDVIPLANPDGADADTRGNANNVDLNRNFPSKNWVSKLPAGDTAAKSAGLSGGASGGSEPETTAMIDYLKRGFANVVSLHSSGGIVDYDGPGGLVVAKRISKATGLPVQHLDYQPSVHGSMGLYIPETYDIPIITLELNSSRLSDKTMDGIMAAFE